MSSPSSSTKPELVYFDAPGRGENIRILLHAAGIDFVDTRIAFTDWPSKKASTPLGNIPTFTMNGITHVQSMAILRYVGKLAGFYPEDPLEALIVDEVLDTINELASAVPQSNDPEELRKLQKELHETTMKQRFQFIERLIQKNGGTYVAGNAVTIGDLCVRFMIGGIQAGFLGPVDETYFNDFPGVMASKKAADENEKVMAYYASQK